MGPGTVCKTYDSNASLGPSTRGMKPRSHTDSWLVATLTILRAGSSVPAQTIDPPRQESKLPASPFAVAVTIDDQYVFVSLGAAKGIAIVKQGRISAGLAGVLTTGGGTTGLAITADGKYLLDAVRIGEKSTTPEGLQIIDIQEAVHGQAGAIVRTIPIGDGAGVAEVGLSDDNYFAFVSNEFNDTVSVIELKKALASGESTSSIVGKIPVEKSPVGLAFSSDGRHLYVTCARPSKDGTS